MDHTIDQVLKDLGKREIYIYGAGCWGNLFYQYCKKKGIPVGGYIVTAIGRQNISNGLAVVSLDDYIKAEKNGQIVICMMYSQEVEELLKKKQIQDAHSLKVEELLSISKELGRELLPVGNGTSRTLKLKDKKFINPFSVDDDYYWEYFMELIDVVLPSEFGTMDYINEGPYEFESVQLEPGDTVFDLGACMGVFSQLAWNKGCNVYAFEPSPRNFQYLSLMEPEYGTERMHLVQTGLADYTGTHEFFTGGATVGYDGFRQHADLKEKIDITVTTIDEFVQKNQISKVDFIKSNIEGAERMMLLGAKNTLINYEPKISMRTNHYPDDCEVLEHLITSINSNYIVKHSWKNLYAWVPDRKQGGRQDG